jgi:hypothetical protein
MIGEAIEIYVGASPTFRILRLFWSYPKSCSVTVIVILIMYRINLKVISMTSGGV